MIVHLLSGFLSLMRVFTIEYSNGYTNLKTKTNNKICKTKNSQEKNLKGNFFFHKR